MCHGVSRDFLARLRLQLYRAIKSRDIKSKKVKGLPYSLPSAGPGAHPGVQAVTSQVTITHPLGGRLPLLSANGAVTFPAAILSSDEVARVSFH